MYEYILKTDFALIIFLVNQVYPENLHLAVRSGEKVFRTCFKNSAFQAVQVFQFPDLVMVPVYIRGQG